MSATFGQQTQQPKVGALCLRSLLPIPVKVYAQLMQAGIQGCAGRSADKERQQRSSAGFSAAPAHTRAAPARRGCSGAQQRRPRRAARAQSKRVGCLVKVSDARRMDNAQWLTVIQMHGYGCLRTWSAWLALGLRCRRALTTLPQDAVGVLCVRRHVDRPRSCAAALQAAIDAAAICAARSAAAIQRNAGCCCVEHKN